MRRISMLCLAIAFAVCCAISPAVAWGLDVDSEPDLKECTAACLTDSQGNILYGLDEERELAPASITKVMTAMVALDQGVPFDTVIDFVPLEYMDDAQLAGYEAGDTPTFGELMRVMLIFSGNDAASNVAIASAGSEEAFVELMNAKAEELGLEHTHFANPHGLEEDGHYSCAADLCKMGRYAMDHYPFIRTCVTIPSIDIVVGGIEINLESTDHLMGSYEGLRGIKTGVTQMGASFLGSARRDNVTLYSCVLCCDTGVGRWDDTETLLDWGFDLYHDRTLSLSPLVTRVATWEDGFWLRCPVNAQQSVTGKVFTEGKVDYTTVMNRPNGLVPADSTYGTTVWNQEGRLVGSVAYHTQKGQSVGAWNPLVMPLFESSEG